MDTMTTEWKTGDDPMMHDLWELQVSLEQAMLRDGIGIDAPPLYQPTVIPPRRWDAVREGGYYTPYAMTPKPQCVGGRDSTEADFAAINALQEKPWRIDPQALAAAERAAERQPPTDDAEVTLRTARRYQQWVFYFPYCWDDEGRARPVPVYLNPEGSELARSLLVPL